MTENEHEIKTALTKSIHTSQMKVYSLEHRLRKYPQLILWMAAETLLHAGIKFTFTTNCTYGFFTPGES